MQNIEHTGEYRPVKRGRWKWEGFNIVCPFCDFEPMFDSTEPLYNYCPNCGAKMNGERREYGENSDTKRE